MKRLSIMILLLATAAATFAQNKKYIAAMEKNITMMDTARSINSYQAAANGFERIASAEATEWLPQYYLAFCNVMMAGIEKDGDKVDAYCDKADGFLDKAEVLTTGNSEIYTLRSLINSMRIKVNPMGRGQKYGTEAGINLAKAKELDPTNPRPWLLDAQGKLYTPPAFGGGKDKAIPLFEEAIKKYETFQPASSIHPNWGKTRAAAMLEDAKK